MNARIRPRTPCLANIGAPARGKAACERNNFSETACKLSKMGRVGKLALVLLLAHATTATTIAGELVKSEIKDIVSSYLTGPEFTMKIVSIVQAAVQHEVAAALASAAPPSSSRRLVEASTGVVCSMHSCGDTEACSAWNKDIDDVARSTLLQPPGEKR